MVVHANKFYLLVGDDDDDDDERQRDGVPTGNAHVS
jgi:hypothetical protein